VNRSHQIPSIESQYHVEIAHVEKPEVYSKTNTAVHHPTQKSIKKSASFTSEKTVHKKSIIEEDYPEYAKNPNILALIKSSSKTNYRTSSKSNW
jgi:hypothetical protein